MQEGNDHADGAKAQKFQGPSSEEPCRPSEAVQPFPREDMTSRNQLDFNKVLNITLFRRLDYLYMNKN